MSRSTAVGLDIGTTCVRAAEVSLRGQEVRLERFGQVALPPGAVRDGEVADSAAVAAALRELWSRTKIKSKRVVIGVSNAKVVVRQVDLPWLPAAEMKESLPFLAADQVPMSIDEVELDFLPIEDLVQPDGTRLARGMLVAASREMVMAALDAVRGAGLDPVTVDLTSFALLRGTPPGPSYAPGQPEALVDVGGRVTNIVVHERGQVHLVRILLMGGQDVTEALVEKLGMGMADAEQLKRQTGLPGPGVPAPDESGRVLQRAATSLIEEIKGSLDYYAATTGGGAITRVVLSGGGSRLPRFAEELAAALRVQVEYSSVLSRVPAGNTGLTTEQLAYVQPFAVVPIGLAMGGLA